VEQKTARMIVLDIWLRGKFQSKFECLDIKPPLTSLKKFKIGLTKIYQLASRNIIFIRTFGVRCPSESSAYNQCERVQIHLQSHRKEYLTQLPAKRLLKKKGKQDRSLDLHEKQKT